MVVMKPFFSLLLVMVTMSTIYANALAQTSITVYAENNELFYLFLNNEQINEVPASRVSVSDLILKDYRVSLKWKDITQPGLEDVVKVKQNAERVFIITSGKKGFEIKESGTSKKGEGLQASRLSGGKTQQEVHSCLAPVGEAEFSALTDKLKTLDYPQDKVSLTKNKITTACYTVNQLGVLLSLLDYESDKTEVAKYAYSYIYDKKNYPNLAGLFEYPGAYEDIQRYLKQQPSYF